MILKRASFFTITIFLVACWSAVHAQFHSMLHDGNLWETHYVHALGSEIHESRTVQSWIAPQKDTIVDGKLYRSFNVARWYLEPPLYMREDLNSGVVFGVRDTGWNEFVVYDFSLNIGDTFSSITHLATDGDTLVKYVSQKDSILIDGTWRIRIEVKDITSTYCPEIWIEGIGSGFGPLGQGGDCWHISYYLVCFAPGGHDTPSVYPVGSSCGPKGIALFDGLEGISIHPNPSNKEFTIKGRSNNAGCVHLTSMFGETIKLQTLTNNVYDIADLPAGVYLVWIEEGAKTETRKLVKR